MSYLPSDISFGKRLPFVVSTNTPPIGLTFKLKKRKRVINPQATFLKYFEPDLNQVYDNTYSQWFKAAPMRRTGG